MARQLANDSQEMILRAVGAVGTEDSKQVIHALNESRDMLHTTLEEFKREQDEYRRQLTIITGNRRPMKATTENGLPLSIFMRHKQQTPACIHRRNRNVTETSDVIEPADLPYVI